MKIGIIGTGYVGMVTAVGLAGYFGMYFLVVSTVRYGGLLDLGIRTAFSRFVALSVGKRIARR